MHMCCPRNADEMPIPPPPAIPLGTQNKQQHAQGPGLHTSDAARVRAVRGWPLGLRSCGKGTSGGRPGWSGGLRDSNTEGTDRPGTPLALRDRTWDTLRSTLKMVTSAFCKPFAQAAHGPSLSTIGEQLYNLAVICWRSGGYSTYLAGTCQHLALDRHRSTGTAGRGSLKAALNAKQRPSERGAPCTSVSEISEIALVMAY